MYYYKIINDETFVGVGTSLDMRRYQKKHEIVLSCDETKAQFIQVSNKFYHDNWLLPIHEDGLDYIDAEIIRIDKEEYDSIHKAVESGMEIIVEEGCAEDEPEIINNNESITIDYMRHIKVKEMSKRCSDEIINGIDVELSDGAIYHFSLTIQDQLNLLTLSAQIMSGTEKILYHADGEMCKYYSTEDISKIIAAANNHKTHHTTYFNLLKMYILSMKDINEISEAYYGMELPDEYKI